MKKITLEGIVERTKNYSNTGVVYKTTEEAMKILSFLHERGYKWAGEDEVEFPVDRRVKGYDIIFLSQCSWKDGDLEILRGSLSGVILKEDVFELKETTVIN